MPVYSSKIPSVGRIDLENYGRKNDQFGRKKLIIRRYGCEFFAVFVFVKTFCGVFDSSYTHTQYMYIYISIYTHESRARAFGSISRETENRERTS